jgi:hypothetical protein
MALTSDQFKQLEIHWPLVIRAIYPTITDIPDGGGDSIASKLGTWRDLVFSKPTVQQVEDALLNTVLPAVETEETANAANAAKVAAAETNAGNIPGWATWDEATALAWIDGKFDATTINNISSLTQAKPVIADMATAITALARLVIALRDKNWPGLGE